MNEFMDSIKKRARKNPLRIVYPESSDERVLRAVNIVVKEGIAKPILLGDPKDVIKKINSSGLSYGGIEIIDHLKSDKIDRYAKEFYNLRKEKGVTLKQAKETMENGNYFGTMMVHMGDAEGLISGAVGTTAETVLPAFQIIKTKEPDHRASGVFFMIFKDKVMLFADSAVNPEPDAHELANIALDTADTARKFGFAPKVAMLSFSTKGSAKHPLADKVIEATKIASSKDPALLIDGELQLDAAVEPEVARMKCPTSRIKGDANVLIFPDLNAANIGYKIASIFGRAEAVGPIIQGLRKPINDLSRGCKVKDIVDVTAITVIEAQEE